MARVLLIGAGFSYNWKGWLASEIFGDLAQRIANDPYLSGVLRGAESFEDALAKLQNDHAARQTPETEEALRKFEGAIVETFGAMNDGFARRGGMNFCNDEEFSIIKFLTKFDAIFSLNQDLLLEMHYRSPMAIAGYPRWSGLDFPGMKPRPDGSGNTDAAALKWQPDSEFRIHANIQPLFKLHGSTNWYEHDGRRLLVMGGDKVSTIWRQSVLRRYSEEFERYLSAGNSRLMVIGYGFRDRHINDIILRAWQKSGLGTFIVQPEGREILRKVNRTYGKPLYCPEPLDVIDIIGESTRALSSTFGGCDPAEHGKLLRFFQA